MLQAVTAKVVDKLTAMVLATQPESVEEGKSVKIAVMPVDKDGNVTTAKEEAHDRAGVFRLRRFAGLPG